MALDLIHPEDEPYPDDDSLERMERGKERERAIQARMIHVGERCRPPFDVIEQQRRFEIRDRDGAVLIVGRIDGRLDFGRGGHRPIFEVKSGEAVRRVERLEDLDRSRWTRHMLDQQLAYLLAEGEPWGVLVLDRPGLPKFLRVDLEEHLERAEGFLRDARAAVDARFERAPVPDVHEDRSECRRCPHLGKSCAPDLDYGEGLQVIDDERLVELAEIREQNAEAHVAYQDADKRLKERLRGVERGLLGPFSVTGKWSRKTSYDIPGHIKERFRKVDERGRFALDIERIPEEVASNG